MPEPSHTAAVPLPTDGHMDVAVLAVDDIVDNLDVLEAVLKRPGQRLIRASSGEEALELLLRHEVAVALLDVQMPGMDGFELAELMRGAERTRRIPIIFLTAGSPDASRMFRGYEAGAVDFLFKPLDARLLRGKVDVFIELFRQRQLLAERLEESRQLLRTSELLFGVLGHDLRSPLSAIVHGGEVLRLRTGDDEVLQRVAMAINSSARRMTRLISQLLDFGAARLGNLPVSPREADLERLARLAMQELEGRRPPFETAFSGDTSGVWDPDRMLQVLANLLGNAMQHGTPGDPIRIGVDGTTRDEVEVTVSNRGTLPADIASALFQPFAHSSAETRGTGLGLYIVDQIVRAHGGTVEASSAEDWTTFRIRLPRHAPVMEAPPPVPALQDELPRA